MPRYPVSPNAQKLVQQAEQALHFSGRPKSIQLYNEALSLEPNCAYAIVQRGLALQEEGHLAEAVKDYARALELDPQFGLAYYGRSWGKLWAGDAAGSLEDARKGLVLDIDNREIYLRRIATALGALKHYTEAIEIFDKVIDMQPNDEGTIFNRGSCYADMGRHLNNNTYFESAIKDFTRCLELDSDWTWAFFQRANCYIKLRQFELAVQDISAVLHYDPSHKEAQKLYVLLMKQGKPDKPSKSFLTKLADIIFGSKPKR